MQEVWMEKLLRLIELGFTIACQDNKYSFKALNKDDVEIIIEVM